MLKNHPLTLEKSHYNNAYLSSIKSTTLGGKRYAD